MSKFERTKLPYSFDALEPFMDAKTMEIHSEKHHQTYTDKLNAALEGKPEYQDWRIEVLLRDLDKLPDDIRTIVKNNGGGFVNHNIFFSSLKKNEGGKPVGELAKMIEEKFESFEKFKEQFTQTALGVFGSGWVWLALDENGENPHIHGLPLQENPYMHKHLPVLGLDVWEHAYYLKYQNRRPEYVEAFWNVIDWEVVNEMYVAALKGWK